MNHGRRTVIATVLIIISLFFVDASTEVGYNGMQLEIFIRYTSDKLY